MYAIRSYYVAYLQDFRMMMFITLTAIPLIFLLRAPPKRVPALEIPLNKR